jgi:hypothetical protein
MNMARQGRANGKDRLARGNPARVSNNDRVAVGRAELSAMQTAMFAMTRAVKRCERQLDAQLERLKIVESGLASLERKIRL